MMVDKFHGEFDTDEPGEGEQVTNESKEFVERRADRHRGLVVTETRPLRFVQNGLVQPTNERLSRRTVRIRSAAAVCCCSTETD